MLYRTIDINHIYLNTFNDIFMLYFLHCSVQRHFSAIVMSHLQVDYFSLVRQNIQLAMLLLLLLTRSLIIYINFNINSTV